MTRQTDSYLRIITLKKNTRVYKSTTEENVEIHIKEEMSGEYFEQILTEFDKKGVYPKSVVVKRRWLGNSPKHTEIRYYENMGEEHIPEYDINIRMLETIESSDLWELKN